jgi:hypothetical protein
MIRITLEPKELTFWSHTERIIVDLIVLYVAKFLCLQVVSYTKSVFFFCVLSS